MIWVFDGKVFLLMTRDAIRGQHCKVSLLLRLMTAFAVHQGVPAHHGEARVAVYFFNVENLPSLERMAFFTIAAHFCLVNVLMTRKTVGAYFPEIFDVMARLAVHLTVAMAQREFGFVVIETDSLPGTGNMAAITIEIFLLVRVFLSIALIHQTKQQHHAQSCQFFATHKKMLLLFHSFPRTNEFNATVSLTVAIDTAVIYRLEQNEFYTALGDKFVTLGTVDLFVSAFQSKQRITIVVEE